MHGIQRWSNNKSARKNCEQNSSISISSGLYIKEANTGHGRVSAHKGVPCLSQPATCADRSCTCVRTDNVRVLGRVISYGTTAQNVYSRQPSNFRLPIGTVVGMLIYWYFTMPHLHMINWYQHSAHVGQQGKRDWSARVKARHVWR